MHHRRETAREDEGELNTVPYLDILMNLIIFMLLSMSGLAAMGAVNVTTTHPAPGEELRAAPPPPRVAIGVAGFEVRAGASSAVTIPRTPEGTYDYAALSAYLERVKQDDAPGTKLLLSASGDIGYETVIATLDACRETRGESKRLLFPEVSLEGR